MMLLSSVPGLKPERLGFSVRGGAVLGLTTLGETLGILARGVLRRFPGLSDFFGMGLPGMRPLRPGH